MNWKIMIDVTMKDKLEKRISSYRNKCQRKYQY